jgi:hypothetical protein
MSVVAFVSDQHSINRILEHLGLRPPERGQLDVRGLGARLVRRDRAALQPLGEILAGHGLHRQEVRGRSVGKGRPLEAVNVGDVGVVE